MDPRICSLSGTHMPMVLNNMIRLVNVLTKNVAVRLSLLRKTILNPEYWAFMCVCVFVDGCISIS